MKDGFECECGNTSEDQFSWEMAYEHESEYICKNCGDSIYVKN